MSGNANASLISIDSAFGADTITRDTATGLEWLDPIQSLAQTYNFVSSQFGSGQPYEGFRHATREEVQELFDNAGLGLAFGDPNNNYDGGVNFNAQPFVDLLNLLGGSLTNNPVPNPGARIHGFTSTDITGEGSATGLFAPIIQLSSTFEGNDLIGTIYATGLNPSQWGSDVGHWLVRETSVEAVPEPGVVGLLLASLAVFGVVRRRKFAS